VKAVTSATAETSAAIQAAVNSALKPYLRGAAGSHANSNLAPTGDAVGQGNVSTNRGHNQSRKHKPQTEPSSAGHCASASQSPMLEGMYEMFKRLLESVMARPPPSGGHLPALPPVPTDSGTASDTQAWSRGGSWRGNARGGRGGFRGVARGRGGGGYAGVPKPDDVCHGCGERGHWVRACKRGRAHLCQQCWYAGTGMADCLVCQVQDTLAGLTGSGSSGVHPLPEN